MEKSKPDLLLSDFDISEERGFVPDVPPLKRLPPYFSPWEELSGELSGLLQRQRGEVRSRVELLPELEFTKDTLKSEAEWWRALVVVTYIGQAYIWGEGEERVPQVLPRVLAIPWWSLSQHLDVPPVISYAVTVTHNWGLVDEDKPMDLDNLYSLITFSGTQDEAWFYLVALFLEVGASPGVKAVVDGYNAVARGDKRSLGECLIQVEEIIRGSMLPTLKRMYEKCEPQVFYNSIRPYQAGSKGIPALTEGLVFEGVDPHPKQFSGASAGQSATMHTFDIFFGTKHAKSNKVFFEDMRLSMPARHRQFLAELSTLPPVVEFIRDSRDPELIQLYNKAVEAFADFRSEHVVLVTRYIVLQKSKSGRRSSMEMKGTGGSDFMFFLKSVRDDTLSMRISLE